jgi:hypothetical protein
MAGQPGHRPLVCLFVGPSVPAAELGAIFAPIDAELRLLPPARQGDLLRLLTDRPAIVGLIDGYFFHVPAVLHREILLLLERGTRVLGAASLGALRAAELDVHGMEGVGEIYRWYRDGVIDADDEVAVGHADASDGYRPLTVALVNLRHGLRLARRRGIIGARTARTVLAAGQQTFVAERTSGALLSQGRAGRRSGRQGGHRHADLRSAPGAAVARCA